MSHAWILEGKEGKGKYEEKVEEVDSKGTGAWGT